MEDQTSVVCFDARLTHWMNRVKTGGPVKKHEILKVKVYYIWQSFSCTLGRKQKRREAGEIEREGYWRAHDAVILDFVLRRDRTRYITTQQNVFCSAERVWSKAWCRSTHVVWYHRDRDYWSTNHSGSKSQNQTGVKRPAYMDRRRPLERNWMKKIDVQRKIIQIKAHIWTRNSFSVCCYRRAS